MLTSCTATGANICDKFRLVPESTPIFCKAAAICGGKMNEAKTVKPSRVEKRDRVRFGTAVGALAPNIFAKEASFATQVLMFTTVVPTSFGMAVGCWWRSQIVSIALAAV